MKRTLSDIARGLGLQEEIEVDGFAGGGGTSTGLEEALGRSPALALNHDAVALAMHEVNHPETEHLLADIWDVDPRKACRGRPVGLGWFSPDCKHFSKAKGGKPVEKKIRGLAWVVLHWANTVAPRVIILENVEEFQTWGPLAADGRPCPIQKGLTFKRWVSEFERLGYVVEWRELRACDYGAPTIRKRLFLIARRDGEPIIWPQPSHGDPKSEAVKSGQLKPWRTAAEIIDWSLPCPSIFDSAAEIMAKYGLRAVRPLQPATMARIAKGVKRYVLDAAKPFIVRTDMASGSPRNGVHSTDEPVRTMTSAQSFAVVNPHLVNLTHQGGERSESLDDPTMTVTAAHRGEKALVMPFVTGVGGRMAQTEPRGVDQPAQTLTAKADSVLVTPFVAPRYQEKAGQEPRTRSLEEPAATVTSHGNAPGMLVAPHLTKFRANSVGSRLDEPAPTVTANSFIKRPGGCAPIGVVTAHLQVNTTGHSGSEAEAPVSTIATGGHHQVIAPHLMTMRNAQKPFNEADKPAHTITSGGAHMHLVAAFMAQHNVDGRTGEGNAGRPADEPVSTVLQSGSHQGLVAANLLRQFGTGVGSALDEPARTVMADGAGKTQLSAAFLSKYYGTGEGQVADDPLHTVTTKDREALVTVDIEGETYVITDIGMRMLTPRELFRAQGFPDSYIIDRKPDGSPISKTEQVSKCGNSVCPPMAAALVKANYAPRDVEPAPQFMEAAE